MNLFELFAKISVDDSDFKKSMENAKKVSKNVAKAMQELQTPLDKVKSGFNAIAHPIETAKKGFEYLKNKVESVRHPIETFKAKVQESSTALESQRNKLSVLAAVYDSAQKKVDELTKEFNKSAKESGTSSKKTQELAEKLKEAESEAANAKKEMDDFAESVSKAGKNSGSAKDKIAGLVGGLGKVESGLGTAVATAAKVGAAAVGAAAAGIAALTKSAVSNYAEYEQLAGGAQKIFDQIEYSKILNDANNAYKILGLSANQYLSIMNDVGATFAATMGDEAGYETAKTGLKAISDYASGTGKNVGDLPQKFTLITRSTASYQSIADQFSGILPATSAGFLEQAQAAGFLSDKYTQLTEVPLAEYQAAVSKMLKKGVADLNLENNTMEEAFSTLSGSLAMAKGAWSNLVTGIANDSADLDVLVGNFVESVGAVATNLIPKIGTALNGTSKLVRDLIPVILHEIPVLIEENLPILAESAISIIQSLVDGISKNREMLMTTAFETIAYLANSLISMLPQIVRLGLDLIVSLGNGISDSLPELIPTVIDVALQIVDTLTDPATLKNLLDGAMAIITSIANYLIRPDVINMLLGAAIDVVKKLATFLIDNLSPLLNAAIEIIMALVDYILEPDNLAKLVETAIELVVTIAGALGGAAGELVRAAEQLILKIIEKFKETDWKELGRNLVDGFKRGIQNAWSNLKDWFKCLFGDLIGIAKKILGIASPSKVFKKIGGFTAEGFGVGFEDEFAHVKDDMEDALNFEDASVGINASIRKVGAGSNVGAFGGTSIGNVTINIDGAKYSDENSLAEAIAEALQNMTGRREAVYA